MQKLKILILLLTIFTKNQAFAQSNIQPVKFYSEAGISSLEAAKYKNDFYQLVNFFQPQINSVYCGIASSVIVLNALNYGDITSNSYGETTLPKAMGEKVLPYNLYTQQNFLNSETNKIKHRDIIELKSPKKTVNQNEIFDPGLTLGELSSILRTSYKLKVKTFYTEKNNLAEIEKFRQLLKNTVSDKSSFLISNFDGKTFRNSPTGHISPVVAYNQENDTALILDVATHKSEWYWVKIEHLYTSMNSKDGENYRGFIIVSKNISSSFSKNSPLP